MAWHPDAEELQSLIDGELDPLARPSIEAHVQSCRRCAERVRRLRQVSDVLGAIPRPAAPSGLEAAITAAVANAAPVREITCAECLELASQYIDHELSGGEREALEAHLFACEECFAAFKQMERTSSVLRDTPRQPAPAGLHRRISVAVAADARRQSVFAWRRVMGGLAGLAAAAALLVVIFAQGPDATDQTQPTESMIARESADAIDHAPQDGTVEDPAGTRVAEAPGAESESAAADDAASAAAREPFAQRIAVATEPAAVEPSASMPAPDTTPAPEASVEDEPSAPERTVVVPAPRQPAEPSSEAPRPAREPARPEREPEPAPTGPVLARAPEAPDAEPATATGPVPPPDVAAPVTTEPEPGPEIAVAPRLTGPEQPRPIPAQPEVVVETEPEPERLADASSVLPKQTGGRTLRFRNERPVRDAIERVNENLNREAASSFDTGRLGLDL